MKHAGLILIATFFLITHHCFSINYTWNGTTSTAFNNPVNWTPAGVPGNFDNVTINAGTPFSPALTNATNVTNFTLNAGSTFSLNSFNLITFGTATLNSCTINGTGNYSANGGINNITNLTCNVNLLINGGTWTINNSTFNMPLTLVRSGGVGILVCGGNTYNSTLSVINNSAMSLRFGVTNPEIYNSSTSFENQSTGTISLAYNTANNMFNGNITINSLVSLGFMNFGIAGGTSVLNDGFTILEGTPGFLGGTLEIRNLTQLGNSVTHTLNLSILACCSSTSLILKLGPGNIFNGNVDFTASNILLNGGVYNGPAFSNFTKSLNGSAISNMSDGGNIFNSPDTYITNQTTSALTLSNINPDDYNTNAHFVKGISGSNIHVAYNGVNTFSGNIEVAGFGGAGGLPVQFGYGTGTVLLDGTGTQVFGRINPALIAPPSITRLTTNKPSGNSVLNTSVNILNTLTLTSGIFNTSTGNYMILNNGATTSIGIPNSFVNGPMIYMHGSNVPSTLNLPIGKGGIHRPAILNVTHTDATVVSYTAEVMNASAMALGYSFPPTINLVSYIRYWQIDRQAIPNLLTADVTLYYGPDDGVSDPANLSIAKNIGTGTAWFDMGGTGSAAGSGNITSIPFNTFSRFTLANDIGGTNPLPIELISFTATAVSRSVELNWVTISEVNNDYFTIERSTDAIQYEVLTTVDGAGNSNQMLQYSATDNDPFSGISYYRLKQTDFNNDQTYSSTVAVTMNESAELTVYIYPNPSDGIFNIFLSGIESEEVEIKITDMCGKVYFNDLFSIAPNHSTLQLSNEIFPASGIYTLQIVSGHGILTSKIMIN